MNLNTFFQLSVIIFCIVATLFIFILFMWAIKLRVQLNKLIIRLENISSVAETAAEEAKDSIEKSIQSLETFKNGIFAFKLVPWIATQIISIIKNNSKGVKNGKEK